MFVYNRHTHTHILASLGVVFELSIWDLSACLIILCIWGEKKIQIKHTENREQGKSKIKKKKVSLDKVPK